MPIKYMILSHARTGSNFLVSVLAQHPDIESHNELFHERTIFTSQGAINDEDVIKRRDKAVVPYLQKTLKQSDKPVRGFKHLLFNNQEIIEYVMNGAFHLILLERENILAQYSSFKIALNTKQWTVFSGDGVVKPSPLVWDVADFEAYRKQYTNTYDSLKTQTDKRKYPAHHVYYTDLLAQKAQDAIFTFLEVHPVSVDDSILPRKQNTKQIIDRFEQPDVVRDHLKAINYPQWETESV